MRRQVCWYEYTNEVSQPRFCKVRYEPKDFDWGTFLGHDAAGNPVCSRNIRSDRRDEWHSTLYNLPEVVAALRVDVPVAIVEGEKDAENLASATGVVATTATNPVYPRIEQAEWFTKFNSSSDLLLTIDQDPAGGRIGWRWVRLLREVGVEPRRLTVLTPKRHSHKDASDVVAAGLGLDGFRVVDLARLEKSAARYTPTSRTPGGVAGDEHPQYDGLVFEQGWGWVNPDTGYTVEFAPDALDWKPTTIRRDQSGVLRPTRVRWALGRRRSR